MPICLKVNDFPHKKPFLFNHFLTIFDYFYATGTLEILNKKRLKNAVVKLE